MLLDPSTDTEDIIYLDNITLSLDGGTGLDDVQLSDQVMLYPIPFGDEVKLVSELAIVQVNIYDILGKQVYNQDGLSQTNLSIDASEFAPGAYVITIINEAGQHISKQVLK
jgi:hypothetical protein